MSEIKPPKIADLLDSLFAKPTEWEPLHNLIEPPNLEPATIRNWILDVASALFQSVTSVARMANIAPSTLNRFVSGKSENVNLNARTIELLKETIRNEIERVIKNGDEVVSRKDIARHVSSIKLTAKIFVDNGIWRANPIIDCDEKVEISIPFHPAFKNSWLLATQVSTSNIDPLYPKGSILIVERVWRHDRVRTPGTHVIVLRSDERGFETSLCEVTVDHKERWWAQPLGASTASPELMFIDQAPDEATKMWVIAEVMCSYRAPRQYFPV